MDTVSILVTADRNFAAPLRFGRLPEHLNLRFCPLERYFFAASKNDGNRVKEMFGNFTFIHYSNLRNARFFFEWAERNQMAAEIPQKINLAVNTPTSKFLEEKGIPAIRPAENARAIDILEFILRISREGQVLCPACNQKPEELPGLLTELEMPVTEFAVCKEAAPDPDFLKDFKKQYGQEEIDAVLFHNRSSVVRTKAAFPGLNFSALKLISAAAGVTEKMAEEGIEPDLEASGSWNSVFSVLRRL